MEIFKFELKLKQQDVELSKEKYTIFELTGRQRDEYLNNVSQRVKYVNGVATGMSNLTGLQSSLLAMCLKDEDGKLVKESVIQDFPGSVQSQLFTIAQKLSGLDQAEKIEEVKND